MDERMHGWTDRWIDFPCCYLKAEFVADVNVNARGLEKKKKYLQLGKAEINVSQSTQKVVNTALFLA